MAGFRHAQKVTRVRKAGVDAKGKRINPSEPLTFRAAFAPTVTADNTQFQQTTTADATFYTDTLDVDVVAYDVIESTYPVARSWRVTGVKPWVNPYTGREKGLEILVEVTTGAESTLQG